MKPIDLTGTELSSSLRVLSEVPFFSRALAIDLVALATGRHTLEATSAFELLFAHGDVEPFGRLLAVPESLHKWIRDSTEPPPAEVVAGSARLFADALASDMGLQFERLAGRPRVDLLAACFRLVAEPHNDASMSRLAQLVFAARDYGRSNDLEIASATLANRLPVEHRSMLFIDALMDWNRLDHRSSSRKLRRVLNPEARDATDALAAHLIGVEETRRSHWKVAEEKLQSAVKYFAVESYARGESRALTSLGRLRLERGVHKSSTADLEASVNLFLSAVELSKQIPDVWAVEREQTEARAKIGLSKSYWELGSVDKALDLARDAVDQLSQFGVEHLWAGINLGELLTKTGRHSEAAGAFRLAIEAHKRIPGGSGPALTALIKFSESNGFIAKTDARDLVELGIRLARESGNDLDLARLWVVRAKINLGASPTSLGDRDHDASILRDLTRAYEVLYSAGDPSSVIAQELLLQYNMTRGVWGANAKKRPARKKSGHDEDRVSR